MMTAPKTEDFPTINPMMRRIDLACRCGQKLGVICDPDDLESVAKASHWRVTSTQPSEMFNAVCPRCRWSHP